MNLYFSNYYIILFLFIINYDIKDVYYSNLFLIINDFNGNKCIIKLLFKSYKKDGR